MNFWTYDIKKHNYIQFTSFPPKKTPNFWKSIWREWNDWRKEAKNRCKFEQPKTNSVLFVSPSINNTKALEPIWSHLPQNLYSVIQLENIHKYFPTTLVTKYSFRYLFPLVWAYLTANSEEKLNIRGNFSKFFQVMGYLTLTQQLLERNRVSLIVMANDHYLIQRGFLAVAKEMNIPTVYTQHCSVTERFPQLRFTYSFLDGQESLQKYAAIGGVEGKVYISGNPRFDQLKYYRDRRQASGTIGIAINLNDGLQSVCELCQTLANHGFADIIVRPHPRQEIDESWFVERNIGISNSKSENSFEFLCHIRYLIAGESGIHLDAAMIGVPSVCYGFSKDEFTFDWYSYIKNGLMPYVEEPREVLQLLQEKNLDKDNRYDLAQWYNAALGTSHEGHIGEMIAEFIVHQQNDTVESFNKKYDFISQNIYGADVLTYSGAAIEV